jgi:hypothetical protein
MHKVTRSLLILVFQKRICPQVSVQRVCAVLQNIWRLKSSKKTEHMANLVIGGHLVVLYTKCLLATLPFTVQTGKRCLKI